MKLAVKGMSALAVLAGAMVFSSGVAAQRPQQPPQPDVTIDAQAKTAAIHELAEDLRDVYVFPDTGDKMAAMLDEHLAHGDYNSITSAKEFAATLTKQMYEVSHDRHLRIIYSSRVLPPEQEQQEEPGPSPREIAGLKKTNFEFEDVKRLDGNIGYLKFTGFEDAADGGATVAGAMAFLANTDALIIDLRLNHGGNPEMVDLVASYFFSGDHSVHLNDGAHRIRGTRDYKTTQWWTLPYVRGQRYVDKEVYILTTNRTFSAGEEFTYDLQAQKRATIVGEATGGGGNSGDEMRIGDHFYVFVPDAQSINPITHTNWEGVGVKPDIAVAPADALNVAQKTALEHLIAKTTDPREQSALKSALEKLEADSAQQKQQ